MGPLRRLALPAALVAAAALPAAVTAYPATNDPTLGAPSVLVSLETTGGLAGADDYMAIGSNGHSRLDTRRGTQPFTVSQKQMRRLRKVLAEARWRSLRSDYPSPGQVADGLSYSTLYRGHVVRTEDGARRPARLERVLALLERIEARHR